MHRLGRRPPVEHEADYYAQLVRADRSLTRNEGCIKPGMLRTVFNHLLTDSKAAKGSQPAAA